MVGCEWAVNPWGSALVSLRFGFTRYSMSMGICVSHGIGEFDCLGKSRWAVSRDDSVCFGGRLTLT